MRERTRSGSAPAPTVLIDFEARWPRHTSAKEEAIITELGLKPARFYQLLMRAARDTTALEREPMTARRVARNAAGRKR